MKEKIFDFIKKNKIFIRFCSIRIVLIIVLVVLFKYFISPIIVIGESMYPTINAGDFILANTTESAIDEIERFDLVVLKYKYDNKHSYIKRVIGLPGDSVKIVNNVIYINGEELSEYYGYYNEELEGKVNDSFINMSEIKLKIDEYFVMGDNRYTSIDSRNEDFGTLNRDDIIGIAKYRIWPLNSFGSLEYQ